MSSSFSFLWDLIPGLSLVSLVQGHPKKLFLNNNEINLIVPNQIASSIPIFYKPLPLGKQFFGKICFKALAKT